MEQNLKQIFIRLKSSGFAVGKKDDQDVDRRMKPFCKEWLTRTEEGGQF